MAPLHLAVQRVRSKRVRGLVVVVASLLAGSIGSAQTTSPITKARASIARPPRIIPYVTGMMVNAAIDSLRWTQLAIVQLDTAARSNPGVVLRQAPEAGTLVSLAKAETLYVATTPGKPRPKRPNVWAGIASAVITGRQPAPSNQDDVSKDPPTDTTTRVPLGPGRDSAVHGEVYQNVTCLPDLVGRTPRMVAALLNKARLKQGAVFRDFSDNIDSGRVFRQHPLAACGVVTGTSVALWFSNGPHPKPAVRLVPGVIGLTFKDAADSLQRVGFRSGHVDSVSDRRGEGKVLRQLPHEGESAHPGDAVDLIITIPPRQIEVPSVIGMTQGQAEQILREAGLNVGRVMLVTVAGRQLGIITQTPSPKAVVDSAALIDIVDNRPPEVRYTEVPNLLGKRLSETDSALKLASLVAGDVVRLGLGRAEQVTDQKPAGGTRVLVGSRVNIALGEQLAVVTQVVPDVLNLTVDSARRILRDSGFVQVSIAGGGDRITSKSVVESQNPVGGTPAPAQTLVSLIARKPPPPPVVPDLVGQRKKDARSIAQLDSLQMIVTSEVRRLRLHDRVVSQDPIAWGPRRPDNTVDVVAEIPIVPPFLVIGMLGIGAVAGVGLRILKGPAKAPSPKVSMVPVTQPAAPPILDTNGRDTLIDSAYTLRFDVTSDATKVEMDNDSIVKATEVRDV